MKSDNKLSSPPICLHSSASVVEIVHQFLRISSVCSLCSAFDSTAFWLGFPSSTWYISLPLVAVSVSVAIAWSPNRRSMSSRVRPFVSGMDKNAQIVPDADKTMKSRKNFQPMLANAYIVFKSTSSTPRLDALTMREISTWEGWY